VDIRPDHHSVSSQSNFALGWSLGPHIDESGVQMPVISIQAVIC